MVTLLNIQCGRDVPGVSKMHRETQALDYAVCEIVSHLNIAFSHLKGWELKHGLNYEVFREDQTIVRVVISPVGWPRNSNIVCRISNFYGSWQAFEGAVNVAHLVSEQAEQICFSVDYAEGVPYITSKYKNGLTAMTEGFSTFAERLCRTFKGGK